MISFATRILFVALIGGLMVGPQEGAIGEMATASAGPAIDSPFLSQGVVQALLFRTKSLNRAAKMRVGRLLGSKSAYRSGQSVGVAIAFFIASFLLVQIFVEHPFFQKGPAGDTQGTSAAGDGLVNYTPATEILDAIHNRQELDLRTAEKVSFEFAANAIGSRAFLYIQPHGEAGKSFALGVVFSERPFTKTVKSLGITAGELRRVRVGVFDAAGRPLQLEMALALFPRVGGALADPDLQATREVNLTNKVAAARQNSLYVRGPFPTVPGVVALRARFAVRARREGIEVRYWDSNGNELGSLHTRLYSDGTVDIELEESVLKRVYLIEFTFHALKKPLDFTQLVALVPDSPPIQTPPFQKPHGFVLPRMFEPPARFQANSTVATPSRALTVLNQAA